MEGPATIENPKNELTDAVSIELASELKLLLELEQQKKQRLEEIRRQKKETLEKLEPIRQRKEGEAVKLKTLIAEVEGIFKKEGTRAAKNWKKALLAAGGTTLAIGTVDQLIKHSGARKSKHESHAPKDAKHSKHETPAITPHPKKASGLSEQGTPAKEHTLSIHKEKAVADTTAAEDASGLLTGIAPTEETPTSAVPERAHDQIAKLDIAGLHLEKTAAIDNLDQKTVSIPGMPEAPFARENVIITPLDPEHLHALDIEPVDTAALQEETVPEMPHMTTEIPAKASGAKGRTKDVVPKEAKDVGEPFIAKGIHLAPERTEAAPKRETATINAIEAGTPTEMNTAPSGPGKIDTARIAETPKIVFDRSTETIPSVSPKEAKPLESRPAGTIAPTPVAIPAIPDLAKNIKTPPMRRAGKTGNILVSEEAASAEATAHDNMQEGASDTSEAMPKDSGTAAAALEHARDTLSTEEPAANTTEKHRVDPLANFPHTDSTVTVGKYTLAREYDPGVHVGLKLERNQIPAELAEKMDMPFYNSLPRAGRLMYLAQMAEQKENPGSWMMIDKEKAMIYVIDENNRAVLSKQIILSKILGDSVSSARYYAPLKTKDSYSFTAAGMFKAETIPTPAEDVKSYGNKLIHIDMPVEKEGEHAGYDKRVFIHRAFPANAPLLRTPTNPSDRRISHRCVRIDQEGLDALYALFGGTKNKHISIGILPEMQPEGKISYVNPETHMLVEADQAAFEAEMEKYIAENMNKGTRVKFIGGKVEQVPGTGETKTTIIYEGKKKAVDTEEPGTDPFPIGG